MEFRLSGNYNLIGVLLLILGSPLLLFSLGYALFSPQNIFSAGMADERLGWLTCTLLGAILVSAALYLLLRHRGLLILTEETVTHRTRFRENCLHYHEIVAVIDQDLHIPPNLVLKSREATLRISQGMPRFSEVLSFLQQRIPLLRQVDTPYLPCKLRLQRTFYLSNGLLSLALVGLMEGLAYLAAREGNPASALGLFLSVSILTGIILLIALVFTLNPKQPLSLALTADTITARYLFAGRRQWAVAQIEHISREPRIRWARQTQVPIHPLVIRFRDGQELVIDELRAREFGYSPERLLIYLRQLYTGGEDLVPTPSRPPQQGPQQQANAWVQQGNTWHQQKAYEKAIAAYEQAIVLWPDYRFYKFIIAEMLFEMQQYTRAAQSYQETVDFIPEHQQAWYSLGQCWMFLGRQAEAAQALDRAVELGIQEDDLQTYAGALWCGAMVHTLLEDRKKAQSYLQKALKMVPNWRDRARQDPLLGQYLDF